MTAEETEEQARWAAVASLLNQAREVRQITKRTAATRAGFTERLWRQLERGVRYTGKNRVVPNLSDSDLANAAVAVGLDPGEVFTAAGRAWNPDADWVSEVDRRKEITHMPDNAHAEREEAVPEPRGKTRDRSAHEEELADAYIAGRRSGRDAAIEEDC